jgi:integrase
MKRKMGSPWQRVKNVPHLWRRRYETANGERREKYYARFTCKLKGKRRCEPLGGDLETAKNTLKEILADDVNKKDFDAAKEPSKQGIIFREWAEDYFNSKIDPTRKAGGLERERRSYKPLAAFFGNILLTDIKRSVIMQYRNKRLQEPIVRRGKVVMADGKPRTPTFLTINRELALLRSLLNLVEEDDVIEGFAAPRFTSKNGKNALIKSERDRARKRVCSADEFRALCEYMPRAAVRVLMALYYTAMRVNEVIKLPWAYVDEKAGFVRLPADYVKEGKPRNVPIVPEMSEILTELRQEQKKVATIGGRVFTRNGRPMKSIRTAFEEARTAAGIVDLRLHDFRHSAVTRWALMGIPQAAIMAAAGHHSIPQNLAYTNLQPDDVKNAFRLATQVQQAKSVEKTSVASY